MADDRELISIRPRKKNKGLKAKLQRLANDSPSPSLNNFLENHLLKLIVKPEIKIYCVCKKPDFATDTHSGDKFCQKCGQDKRP